MACILHIETATSVCSVALSQDGALLFEKEDREGPQHARLLAPFADEALSFADSHAIPLDAVAVSAGPGSYTGLRIGVSLAKGICYARGVRLIAVPTHKVMCVPLLLRDELPDDALLCPMIDARRMEVYAEVYDRALHTVRELQADIVTAESYAGLCAERPFYYFGDGAGKCSAVLAHPNAHFIEGIVPQASWMFPLAEMAFMRGEFADTAYFEPLYLKEFVPGRSKSPLEAIR